MAKNAEEKEGRKLVATHRKARHHYHILETCEAGLALKGPEVKSLRDGQVALEASFARLENGELRLYNMHIAPYPLNTGAPLEPTRTRKLLMKRREIDQLGGKLQAKGLSLIPLELYFKRGWAKVTLALARGKRGPDKREDLRRRDLSREMERSFKGRFKT